MTEYVLQIIDSEVPADDGRLIKCFEVSESSPIPAVVPDNRTQMVTENTEMYNGAVSFYETNKLNAKYTITGDTIEWELRP